MTLAYASGPDLTITLIFFPLMVAALIWQMLKGETHNDD